MLKFALYKTTSFAIILFFACSSLAFASVSVDRVFPAAGSGSHQGFTFRYDDDQYTDIATTLTVINDGFSLLNGCVTSYRAADNSIALLNDNNTTWSTPVQLGTPTTLQNSQCSIDVGESSMAGADTQLLVNLIFSFSSGFAGDKKIYAIAIDKSGALSGWQQVGTWTVPAVEFLGITPDPFIGFSHAITFAYSDSGGYSDIGQALAVVNSTFSLQRGCVTRYSAKTNSIELLNDDNTSWGTPALLATQTTLQNDQCAIDVGSSFANGSGNTLSITLALTFRPSFAGNKQVYGLGITNNGVSSAWQQQVGLFEVANELAPNVIVTPASGTGLSTTLSFQYKNENGYGDIATTLSVVNSGFSLQQGCVVSYRHSDETIALLNDDNTSWSAYKSPGTAVSLQNSQCTLDVRNSSVSASDAVTLTVKLALSFSTVWQGEKNVYGLVITNDGNSSGWQQIGTWSVTSVTAVGVTPNLGSGLSQTFSFQYADANGSSQIATTYAFINSGFSLQQGCVTSYRQSDNTIALLNDDNTSWGTPAVMGTPETLQNSHCKLDVLDASVTTAGNILTVTIPISFTTSFAGPKQVYSLAIDNNGSESGWQQVGSWNVPAQ